MTGTDSPEPTPTVADLTNAILGDVPTMRGVEVAAASGVSLEDARRLWRALGFPAIVREAAFTEADRDALARVAQAATDTQIGMDTMVRVVRAVGHTMSRLADWEVATLTDAMDDFASVVSAGPDGMRAGFELVDKLGPHFDHLLVYAWRRHLAAAVGRIDILGADDDDLHVAQATVGFADLVQFTALSNELDENELGDLVEVFESRCSDVIADHNGRVIKTLGDSVLFMEADPVQAIDIALDIIAVIGHDDRLPDVRIGLATGPVVLRMGDVYGPPVNLAARFTGVARRNRVIIDQRTADLLPTEDFVTRPLPARPIRGFGDLEPVTVRRTRPRH
jgi:adenylate cyclase